MSRFLRGGAPVPLCGIPRLTGRLQRSSGHMHVLCSRLGLLHTQAAYSWI